MARNKSTFGLRLEQLANLMAVGLEQIETDYEDNKDQTAAGLLRICLERCLSDDSALLDYIQVDMERLGRVIGSLPGKSLGELLQNSDTDIGLLQSIKTYYKKLSYSAASETESAIAITIYYAALAGSLVYHKKNISQTSVDMLEQYFALLAEKEWMVPELKKLFTQARTIRQDKRGDV
ncbi:MAG: hypothetical protein AMJ79_10395 [Phycisphaerae bacterium SM23_30]|nr:MAG: hypothetical protein AMJ79_10395 [Phycisphaerae bacterium SM23_30]